MINNQSELQYSKIISGEKNKQRFEKIHANNSKDKKEIKRKNTLIFHKNKQKKITNSLSLNHLQRTLISQLDLSTTIILHISIIIAHPTTTQILQLLLIHKVRSL